MANPYLGEAPLRIGDETVNLRFTWSAMAGLVGRFGPEWDVELNRAFEQYDVHSIADALAIIDGDRPADWFMDASPPWVDVRDAWIVAFNLFMLGVPPADLPVMPDPEEAKEEKRPLAKGTFWSNVGPRLLRLVWRRASSGSRRSTNAPSMSGQERSA